MTRGPTALAADVAAVAVDEFDLRAGDGPDLDASLDLLVTARR